MKKSSKPLSTLLRAFGGADRAPTYDDRRKKRFHNLAKRYLRALAEDLNISQSNYDLRVTVGGIAVAGEVTLHSDRLYIQAHFSLIRSGQLCLMIRGVRGRKDYCGWTNRFVPLVSGCEADVLRTCAAASREAEANQGVPV